MNENEHQHQAPLDACTRCGGNSFRKASVRSAFWCNDDRLVVVEDIPALVCSACQEQFYDDETVMQLDLLRGGGFPAEEASGELRVPVFSFASRSTRKKAS
jgi:YgiT-type zinc finger domain-containing protein